MENKENMSLFASAICLLVLGTVVPGMPVYWAWPLSFLGLMLMMFVIAPNVHHRKK
ncbi:MAG TPA: hypothetical protein VI953_00225 [Candidatus Paceibacterota bacterium]